MKLASLKQGGRDGTLIVVDRDLTRYTLVPDIAATLQQALENWVELAPELHNRYQALNNNSISSQAIIFEKLAAPLPRAYQWLDGSAYLPHVERVRKARGAEVPSSFYDDPLMYQGGSDIMLGPRDPIVVADETWGIDLEAEVAVITDDVEQGIDVSNAGRHIKLVMLVNDVSLRNLIPAELAKGFGFLHGKPPTAFSPVAVTPDELGNAWQANKVHLALNSYLNGEALGNPDAGQDMQFDFARLIQHAAATRPLSAGSIIGSGTVSNADLGRGCSCLAEKRVLEIIDNGEASTLFLKHGDRVRIEMFDQDKRSIFGAIDQVVQA